jgi:hypothetical protein
MWTTKASALRALLVANAPGVVGKSPLSVSPTTTTPPEPSGASACASSSALPPR